MIKLFNFSIILVFSSFLLINNSFAFKSNEVPKEYYKLDNMNSSLISKDCDNIDLSKKRSLSEFIDLALCRNPDTSISWLSLKGQASSLKVAESDYLPSVDFSGSSGESKNNTSSYSSSLTFSFDWLLYDFGQRENTVNSEYYSLLKATYSYNDTIQEVIYSVIEAYAKLYSAKEAVATAIKSEASYKVAYDIAKAKYDLGLVAKVDVLQADTKYSQSVLERQKAENDLLNYQGQFASVLNVKQGVPFNLDKPEIVSKIDSLDETIEKLISKAISERPDIKASEASEESSKLSYLASQKAGMPSLSLYGTKGKTYYRDSDISDGSSSSVGMRLSIPIFTGLKNTYNERKYLYLYESSSKEKEKLKSEIAYEVWSAYNDLKTARKNVDVSEKLVASALESKNVNLGMYKEGLSDMLDVLEAESSYADAENEKTVADYDELIAEASLLKSLGTLDSILEGK